MSSDAPTQQPEQPAGLVCPRCGCAHFWTLRTTRRSGRIVRHRECRHCGRRFTTAEKIVG